VFRAEQARAIGRAVLSGLFDVVLAVLFGLVAVFAWDPRPPAVVSSRG